MLTLEERERAAYISGDLVLAAALAGIDDELQELRAENIELEQENERLQDELGEP